MANIQQYSVTRSGTTNIQNFPRYVITASVEDTDPVTGLRVVIADFTGANALNFPAVMATLTPEQRDRFIELVSMWLVNVKAGLQDI